MVEGVELRGYSKPVGQPVDREESACHEKQRRHEQRRHIAELVDLGDRRGNRDAEGCKAQCRDKAKEGHEEHPGRRVEAESHRHEKGEATVEPGSDPDPQHLRRYQFLDVHRGRQDRVVGSLEAVLYERPEHRWKRAGEDHRSRHHPGAHELDVPEPVDAVHDRRTEADSEGDQVDDRLEHARKSRGLPVSAEVRHLATHHARDRRRLEPPHSASSPVSSTKTSSSEAARRIASGGTAPSRARSAPTIAIAGPAGRTARPCVSAFARTSASRSGGA